LTDLYPGLALGDVLIPEQASILPFKCAASVAKGDPVQFNTHTEDELPSVSPINTDGGVADSIGIALKAGSTGDIIPVCVRGVVKVKACGAITGGLQITGDITGRVDAGATATKTIGKALQTFGAADEGLAMINCENSS